MISKEIIDLVTPVEERVYGRPPCVRVGENEESDPPFLFSLHGAPLKALYLLRSCTRAILRTNQASYLIGSEDDASSVDSGEVLNHNYSSGNEQEYYDLSNNQTKTNIMTQQINLIASRHEGEPWHRQTSCREDAESMCRCAATARALSDYSGRSGKRAVDDRRLLRKPVDGGREASYHRTLVEELAKRSFKTVGSVENIGSRTLTRVLRELLQGSRNYKQQFMTL
ncbi:hypothetical protein HPP92_007320 [Vanilla planifolia]|uniref:Uncharacterized protein n=1 Tax=Vanilla planifolia TaxID=51239 RepID=A0A835RR56_VANPL|nr:hypothetical protein HPP92_007525 [Vanilla planifolia]KAG0490457.1 hypothetical protein HPP92_007320 [Vanilla planifolia]